MKEEERIFQKIENDELSLSNVLDAYKAAGKDPPIVVFECVRAGLGHRQQSLALADTAEKYGVPYLVGEPALRDSGTAESAMTGKAAADSPWHEKLYAKFTSFVLNDVGYYAPSWLTGPVMERAVPLMLSPFGVRDVEDAGRALEASLPEGIDKSNAVIHANHYLPAVAAQHLGFQTVQTIPDQFERPSAVERWAGPSPLFGGYINRSTDKVLNLVNTREEKAGAVAYMEARGLKNPEGRAYAAGYPHGPQVMEALDLEKEPAEPFTVSLMVGGAGSHGELLAEIAGKVLEETDYNVVIFAGFNKEFAEKAKGLQSDERYGGRVKVYSFERSEWVDAARYSTIAAAEGDVLVAKPGQLPQAKVGDGPRRDQPPKASLVIGKAEGAQERTLKEYYLDRGAVEINTAEDAMAYLGNPEWVEKAVGNSRQALAAGSRGAERSLAYDLAVGARLMDEGTKEKFYGQLLG